MKLAAWPADRSVMAVLDKQDVVDPVLKLGKLLKKHYLKSLAFVMN
jgi:hypothetical protein